MDEKGNERKEGYSDVVCCRLKTPRPTPLLLSLSVVVDLTLNLLKWKFKDEKGSRWTT